MQALNFSDVLPVLVVVTVVTVGVVRRQMSFALVLYTLGLVALSVGSPTPLEINPFASTGRFLTAAIPVFLLLARWAERRPWLTWLLLGGGLGLQAVLADFFVNGGWII